MLKYNVSFIILGDLTTVLTSDVNWSVISKSHRYGQNKKYAVSQKKLVWNLSSHLSDANYTLKQLICQER